MASFTNLSETTFPSNFLAAHFPEPGTIALNVREMMTIKCANILLFGEDSPRQNFCEAMNSISFHEIKICEFSQEMVKMRLPPFFRTMHSIYVYAVDLLKFKENPSSISLHLHEIAKFSEDSPIVIALLHDSEQALQKNEAIEAELQNTPKPIQKLPADAIWDAESMVIDTNEESKSHSSWQKQPTARLPEKCCFYAINRQSKKIQKLDQHSFPFNFDTSFNFNIKPSWYDFLLKIRKEGTSASNKLHMVYGSDLDALIEDYQEALTFFHDQGAIIYNRENFEIFTHPLEFFNLVKDIFLSSKIGSYLNELFSCDMKQAEQKIFKELLLLYKLAFIDSSVPLSAGKYALLSNVFLPTKKILNQQEEEQYGINFNPITFTSKEHLTCEKLNKLYKDIMCNTQEDDSLIRHSKGIIFIPQYSKFSPKFHLKIIDSKRLLLKFSNSAPSQMKNIVSLVANIVEDLTIHFNCFNCPDRRPTKISNKNFKRLLCNECMNEIELVIDSQLREIEQEQPDGIVFIDGDQASHTLPRLAQLIAEIEKEGLVKKSIKVIIAVSDKSSSSHITPYIGQPWLQLIHPKSASKDAVDIAICVFAARLDQKLKEKTIFIVTNDHFGTALFQEIYNNTGILVRRDEELDTAVMLSCSKLHQTSKVVSDKYHKIQENLKHLSPNSISNPLSSFVITCGNHYLLPTNPINLQRKYVQYLGFQLLGTTEEFLDQLINQIERQKEVQASWIGNQFTTKNAKWIEFLSRQPVQLFLNAKLGRSMTGSVVLRHNSSKIIDNKDLVIAQQPILDETNEKITWENLSTWNLRRLYDEYHNKVILSHREFCKKYKLDPSNFNKWRQGNKESPKITEAVIALLRPLEQSFNFSDFLKQPSKIPERSNSANNSIDGSRKRKPDDLFPLQEDLPKAIKLDSDHFNDQLTTYTNELINIFCQNQMMLGEVIKSMSTSSFPLGYLVNSSPGEATLQLLSDVATFKRWGEFARALDRVGHRNLRIKIFGDSDF